MSFSGRTSPLVSTLYLPLTEYGSRGSGHDRDKVGLKLAYSMDEEGGVKTFDCRLLLTQRSKYWY